MSPSADEGNGDDLTEKLLDLLVYAPIGLVLDAQALAPDLARRGRQHTAAARQLGELAVKRSLRRFDDLGRSSDRSPSAGPTARQGARTAEATSAPKPAPKKAISPKAKPTKSGTAKKTASPKAKPTKSGTAKKTASPKAKPTKSGASKKAPPSKATEDALAGTATATPEQASLSGDALAIPDYDLLAASQVVKRLDALSADELEAVRRYESATRDRRTILHKVARLQA